MTDYWLIKDGIVAAVLHGVVPEAVQRDHLAALAAEVAALEAQGVTAIEPTSEDLRAASRGLSVAPDRMDGLRLSNLRTAVTGLRAAVAEREAQMLRPVEIYGESAIGQPLAWPRAYRAALLTVTDYVDLPGWRAGKDADRLAAADAYRKALRDLPETYPDPATVVWPERPAGL